MGVGSTLYRILFLLHIFSAIVGFGTVFLNGIHGSQAKKRKGPGGLAISQSVYVTSGVAQYFIYAVLVFGIALVLVSDDVWGFDQLWISLSFLFYIVGIGLSHGMLKPTTKRMLTLQEELVDMGPPPAGAPAGGPPPQVAELERLGQRVGVVSGVLNVLLVILLYLMIWKPGL